MILKRSREIVVLMSVVLAVSTQTQVPQVVGTSTSVQSPQIDSSGAEPTGPIITVSNQTARTELVETRLANIENPPLVKSTEITSSPTTVPTVEEATGPSLVTGVQDSQVKSTVGTQPEKVEKTVADASGEAPEPRVVTGEQTSVSAPKTTEAQPEKIEKELTEKSVEVVPPVLVISVITGKFLSSLQAAQLADSLPTKIEYYKIAFSEIAKTSKTVGVPIDSRLKQSYAVIIFDTLQNLIIKDLSQRAREILNLQQKNQDYSSQLQTCRKNLNIYNGYIEACAAQFTSSGTAALQEYINRRDPAVFGLYFNLLASYVAANPHPTKEDMATAKIYFDTCDQLWGKQYWAPPEWAQQLSLPGYGTGNEIRQALYQTFASACIGHAVDYINGIHDQKSIEDFNNVMQENIVLITSAQQNYQKAWDLYNTLAYDYETSAGNQTGPFLATRDQYGRVINSMKTGTAQYTAGNYQQAALQFSSILINGVPVLTNILTTKAQEEAGNAQIADGQKALAAFIESQKSALQNETISSSILTDTNFVFGSPLATAASDTAKSYSAALTAYKIAGDVTRVPELKSYFQNLTSTLTASIEILKNLGQAALLADKARTLLANATTVSQVNNADDTYRQSIALAQNVDAHAAQLPKTPDYIQLYNALGNLSFENKYKHNAAYAFKQKADHITPATYEADQTQEAFVYDLYIKAYGYKDVLAAADQKEIEDKLKETDLLAQANTLKATAQKTTDWSPQKNIGYYSSSASNIWKNAITAYSAAYNISKITDLFTDAYTQYISALDVYAQAYNANVADGYFKEIGVALIYYQAYLAALVENDQQAVSNYENKITTLIKTYFDEITQIKKNMNATNFEVAWYFYGRALEWQATYNFSLQEQASIIASYGDASQISTAKKLLIDASGQTGRTVTTNFGDGSQPLGNLQSDFALWSIQKGDQLNANATKQIINGISTDGTYNRSAVKQSITSFTNAKIAYQRASEIFSQIQNSQQSNNATEKMNTAWGLSYAAAEVAGVNPQVAANFAGSQVYTLYFLEPSIWQVPPELVLPSISQYIKQFSLSIDDQTILSNLATKYKISDTDWQTFTDLFNALQFPIRFPLETDTWTRLTSLFDTYPLTSDEKKLITDLSAQYTISSTAQSTISNYLLTLPALLYLYTQLWARGYLLSDLNPGFGYDTIAQYFVKLQGAPTTQDELMKIFGLSSDALVLAGALTDAYTYFHKTFILLGLGVKGTKGSLLLYATGDQLNLIENNKIVPPLPSEIIYQTGKNWYPSPVSLFKAAGPYFATSTYASVQSGLQVLNNQAWLSSAYQTKIKMDYMLGASSDDQLVDALSFSDEFFWLQKGRTQIAQLKKIISNEQSDPQTVLRYSLSDEENQTIKNMTYYFEEEMMTGIQGAGLNQTALNNANGDAKLAFARALTNFLIGDPDSQMLKSNLQKTVAQFQAARAFYIDPSKKDLVGTELSTIFARLGALSEIKVLPMDPAQSVPQLLYAQKFSFHDYTTAATMYLNAVAALQQNTNSAEQLRKMQVELLKAYYEQMVENFSAYTLLRNTQSNFRLLAQKYSDWYAQSQAIEKTFVDISQEEIALYQSIWNTLLDSLINIITVINLSAQYVPPQTTTTAQTVIDEYLKNQNDLVSLITDDAKFNVLTWQTLLKDLNDAFNAVTSSAASSDQAILNIGALANALFSALQARYILDWENLNVDQKSASDALTNLINAMSARESAKKTINYLG